MSLGQLHWWGMAAGPPLALVFAGVVFAVALKRREGWGLISVGLILAATQAWSVWQLGAVPILWGLVVGAGAMLVVRSEVRGESQVPFRLATGLVVLFVALFVLELGLVAAGRVPLEFKPEFTLP